MQSGTISYFLWCYCCRVIKHFIYGPLLWIKAKVRKDTHHQKLGEGMVLLCSNGGLNLPPSSCIYEDHVQSKYSVKLRCRGFGGFSFYSPSFPCNPITTYMFPKIKEGKMVIILVLMEMTVNRLLIQTNHRNTNKGSIPFKIPTDV